MTLGRYRNECRDAVLLITHTSTRALGITSSYKNNPRMDSLLRERSSVHSSDRIADAFISYGV